MNAIARAIATRRRWPPDSSDGIRSMYSREADEPEHLLDAPVDLLERHVGLFVQLVADVLADGQRVEQRAFLEDHPEVGAHRHHLVLGQLVDALAVHPDDARRRRCSSPSDDLQRSSTSPSRWRRG